MAIVNQVILGPSAPSSDEYVRPSNCLARPTIATGEKVIYLLCRVFPDETLNWFILQLRCYIFPLYGSITINWGDGQIIVYPHPGGDSPVLAEHLIDYSSLSDWWDEAHTSKQVWVMITPEVNMDIDCINVSRRSNSYSNFCNYGVIEILTGKIGNIAAANFGFYFNNLNNLISMVMYEPITLATNWFGFVDYCNKIESIEGTIVAPTWNYYGAQETYNLRYIDHFKLVGAIEMYNFFNRSGIPKIDMPDLTVTSLYATFYLSQCVNILIKDIVGAANSTAMFCRKLETFKLMDGDGSNCTQYYRFFYGDSILQESPTLNLVNSANNSEMFYECYALTKSNLSNIKASISFYACNFSHAAILEIAGQCLYTEAGFTIDFRLNPNIANLPVETIAVFTILNINLTLA